MNRCESISLSKKSTKPKECYSIVLYMLVKRIEILQREAVWGLQWGGRWEWGQGIRHRGQWYETDALTRPAMTAQHEKRSAVNSTLHLRSKMKQIKVRASKEKCQGAEAGGSWSDIRGSSLGGADPGVDLRVRIWQLKKQGDCRSDVFRQLHLT